MSNKPFIFLTANKDSFTIGEAAKLSPAAYLSKPFQNAEVEAALTMLNLKLKHREIDPYFIFLTENEHTKKPLTIREVDVLRVIILDASSDVIAEKLFISKYTVKSHLRSLYSKFEATSRAALINIVNNVFNE